MSFNIVSFSGSLIVVPHADLGDFNQERINLCGDLIILFLHEMTGGSNNR